VEAVDNPRDAVRNVDIFSVCTDAVTPVMDADWLEAGMHVTNIGGGTDPRIRERTDVITVKLGYGSPDKSVPVAEGGFGGEILLGDPNEYEHNPKVSASERTERRYPLLTDVLTGRFPGRTSDDQITHFIDEGSQGLQFAAVGSRVYQLARERELGREIPTDWLVQDIRD
jgi:alanine dehydrogenase